MTHERRRIGLVVGAVFLTLAAGCSAAPGDVEATGTSGAAIAVPCIFTLLDAIGTSTFVEANALPIDQVCLAQLGAAALPDSPMPIALRGDLRIGIVGTKTGPSWIVLLAPMGAPLGGQAAMSAWLHASLPTTCLGVRSQDACSLPAADGEFAATAFDFTDAQYTEPLVSLIGPSTSWHALFAFDPGGSGGGVGGHGSPSGGM